MSAVYSPTRNNSPTNFASHRARASREQMSMPAMLNLVESSPALAAAFAIGLVLAFQINLHYKLLGGSFIEGLLAAGNGRWCQSTREKMNAAGIPRPRRTIEYAPGLLLDVYDLRSPDKTAGVARCGAVLYFHAGLYLHGDSL